MPANYTVGDVLKALQEEYFNCACNYPANPRSPRNKEQMNAVRVAMNVSARDSTLKYPENGWALFVGYVYNTLGAPLDYNEASGYWPIAFGRPAWRSFQSLLMPALKPIVTFKCTWAERYDYVLLAKCCIDTSGERLRAKNPAPKYGDNECESSSSDDD